MIVVRVLPHELHPPLGVAQCVANFFIETLPPNLMQFRSEQFGDRLISNPLGGGIAISWTIIIFLLAAVATVKFLLAPGHLDFLGENITIHTEGFLGKLSGLMVIVGCTLAAKSWLSSDVIAAPRCNSTRL